MIINPTTVQNPTRVLFVSPGFPSASPFYATIAAALAAADGINPTVIYVYPGLYVENALTMKNNVSIVGVDPGKAIIVSTTNASSILNIAPAAGALYALKDIGMLNTGNPGTCVTISAGTGAATIRITGCVIQSTLGIGIQIVNSNSYAHTFNVEDCTISGAASANLGPIQAALGGMGSTFHVRRCFLDGEESVYQCVNWIYEQCIFNSGGIKTPDAGYSKYFRNCVINGKAVATGAFTGATLGFDNCSFYACSFTFGAGNSSSVWVFDNCKFLAAAADGNVFDFSAGTGSCKLRGCVIDGGKINFSGPLTNFLTLLDTSIRNPTGTLCIASGANVVVVMMGNVTSDKALGANVSNNAAGFNLQVSKPI